MNKFKIYKILDSTSSATYWSFINEEQEDDEFIECVQEKEISKDKLTELFDSEDDLGKSVLFESLLELVETSEEIAVKKFKEEFRQILQKRLLEHKSCKDYWYDYLKKNSDTINKFDGECIVSDLNKINNYIYELEKVLFLFEKNSCKHKLENEDK